mgnify:CR=1 FL=1
MIFMVTKTKDKNGIMQSIMKEAGIGSKAGGDRLLSAGDRDGGDASDREK